MELDLSAVGTSDLGNLKVALAQVRENGTELVGSAMVIGGDPVMATAKAVLDALNRKLQFKLNRAKRLVGRLVSEIDPAGPTGEIARRKLVLPSVRLQAPYDRARHRRSLQLSVDGPWRDPESEEREDMADDSSQRSGAATYHHVGDDYLGQRKLHKSAGWVMLWALGVAAVISGDFFGWNYGLATGGFGGLLVATVLMAIMYVCMVLCIAELSTALPFAGGFYAFTRNAMGPGMAFVNTVTDIVEYVVTPAVVVISIAAYADNIVDLPNWIWWIGFYAVFVAINVWGTKLSFRVSFVAAILSMAVLVFFYLAAIFSGAWSPDLLNNVPVDATRAGASTFLPFGWFGVLASFPFAIWFYLAIEQLPLAAEESH